MNKCHLLIGLILCSLPFFYFQFVKRAEEKIPSKAPLPRALFSKSSKIEFIIPEKKTKSLPVHPVIHPLKNYAREKLDLKQRQLFLVYDLSAAATLPSGATELHQSNGLIYYRNLNRHDNNVVYDQASDKYGILTGEIAVKANPEKVQFIADKYNLEITYQGKMGELFILKTQSLDFFATEFVHFKNEDGIMDAQPDIKFSRFKHQ